MADLRTLTNYDIPEAKQLSDAEFWNQTEKDWELLIGDPANLCLAAERNRRVIGTVTAMNYENKIAWIGMVLVHKEFRGIGVSKLLLSKILEKLKSFNSVKLDATPAGHKVYQKFGFRDEYITYRLTTDSTPVLDWQSIYGDSCEISPLCNISEIEAFDQQIIGANRRSLLKFLLNNFPNKSWILKNNNQIKGFALGRNGTIYNQIGPVSATTTDEAKILITKALSNLKGQPVVVDVPENKKELISWLTSLKFREQRYFIRMHKDYSPFQERPEFQMLLTGPEFG